MLLSLTTLQYPSLLEIWYGTKNKVTKNTHYNMIMHNTT